MSSQSSSSPQATVLSGPQAAQLIARLREAQQQQQQQQGGGGGGGGVAANGAAVSTVVGGAQQQGGGGGGAIKIQAVQTNPQTGVRQIIAIPINAVQANAGAGGGAVSVLGQQKVTVSPMKVRPITTAMSGVGGQGGQQVKVVKLASAATSSAGAAVVGGGVAGTTVVAGGAAGTPSAVLKTVTAVNTGGTVQQVQTFTPSKPETTYSVNLHSSSAASSPMMDPTSSGRKRADIDFDSFSDSKRRKTEKGGKGLRHFSMKVCEKVQAKGSTSYNEVADELVAELTDPRCTSPTDQQYDQKNIRRRVYDALNVLMAMNIISKEKKEIRWLGLPTNSVQEANNLEIDKAKRMDRIRAKTQQLQDLILQQIAFKNLVERNKDREKVEGGPPAPNSAIQLPFIIVNTSKKTVIDCSISNDKMEYLFNFDNTFEIHDDMEVLKRMGLSFGLERGQVTPDNLAKAQSMVPKALEQYVTQLAEKGPGAPFKGMPQVSDPVVLRQPSLDADVKPGSEELGGGPADDLDDDSDVDVN